MNRFLKYSEGVNKIFLNSCNESFLKTKKN